jgi:hypoxanthine-DNA glycosylase
MLILGSMPGTESLRRQQYYAHPRNAFWPIMGALFGAGPDLPYPARIERLRAARVAVWDVVGQCRRVGSLDARILAESVIPNDIPALLRRAPRLQRIFFNGGGAETWFRRCFRDPPAESLFAGCRFVRLPSTSPAYAALSPAAKMERWRRVLQAP